MKKKYIVTLQRYKNNEPETFQATMSGTLADIMDQLLNFVVGFEVSSHFTRWEVVNVKEA